MSEYVIQYSSGHNQRVQEWRQVTSEALAREQARKMEMAGDVVIRIMDRETGREVEWT